MLIPLLAALVTAQVPADTSDFAQGVAYRIEASLDESTDVLTGRAELTYTNRSAVQIDTLWLHQHLNAFRPNSAWARRELEFGEHRFQDLSAAEHAFDRLGQVQIDGSPVQPVYPGAPDSTVVGLPLPAALAPGATATVRFDWTARLSTLPRRQGRSGRHYDFAQWYPRIAAFTNEGWQVQPLLPQGEFFGEFAAYDVTLEVADDQIFGATGVPVSGDPGWASRAAPGYDVAAVRGDFYTASIPTDLGLFGTTTPAGQKRVRWRAEDVHHFAWSIDPEFIYEGTRTARSPGSGEIAVHVLYWPEDEGWAGGVALSRTVAALDWLQEMFGPYPWPQITNLHRVESGGTEFPMMMMNGSPSEGLIVHEGTHQYLHGILANNEFREGWLDEGFTSFMTDWYFEDQGQSDVWEGSLAGIQQLERAGRTQPISLAAAEFQDYNTYAAMTYTKTALVLRMLRWMIGDETMRSALRTFYQQNALEHVDEEDLRAAVAEAAGEDLDWFFDQWLHTTAQLDYGVRSAVTTRRSDGRWVTRVDVVRLGDAWMPVTLQVGEEEVRLTSRERRQVVQVVTGERPERAVLDPDDVLLDIDPSNNAAPVQ
ncbi:MAG: M1 family metallopeptidase [Gemmatimonadota bacterium]